LKQRGLPGANLVFDRMYRVYSIKRSKNGKVGRARFALIFKKKILLFSLLLENSATRGSHLGSQDVGIDRQSG
jgi:hypothetical protein